MIKLIQSLLTFISVCYGLCVFLKPESAIEMQRKFYLKINWRIEPVSMKKEIRNTKIMGICLIIFALYSCLFIVH